MAQFPIANQWPVLRQWLPSLHRLVGRLMRHRAWAMQYLASTASLTIGLVAHSIGFIVLAGALGATQFGILSIITAVANFGLVWTGLGSGELIRRKVARDKSAYPDVFGHALIIMTTMSLTLGIAIAIGLAATVEVSQHPTTNFLIMLMFTMSNIGMFAWISTTELILLAHGNVARANLVDISSGAGRAIAAIVACYGWGITGLDQWVVWHFGFYLIISIGCCFAIAEYGRPRLKVLWGELARGLTISTTGLFMFLRRNADVLALGAVASPAIVGVYSVARRIIGTADVVGASLDRLVYSKLAIAGAGGPRDTLPLAARYGALTIVLCGLTSIALLIAAPWIPWVFGAQYGAAVYTTQFLAWTLILTSLQNLASDALNAAEKHEMRLSAEMTAGIVGTGLLVALTLAYGLQGILVAIYLSGLLGVAALWSMLFWLSLRQPRQIPLDRQRVILSRIGSTTRAADGNNGTGIE